MAGAKCACAALRSGRGVRCAHSPVLRPDAAAAAAVAVVEPRAQKEEEDCKRRRSVSLGVRATRNKLLASRRRFSIRHAPTAARGTGAAQPAAARCCGGGGAGASAGSSRFRFALPFLRRFSRRHSTSIITSRSRGRAISSAVVCAARSVREPRQPSVRCSREVATRNREKCQVDLLVQAAATCVRAGSIPAVWGRDCPRRKLARNTQWCVLGRRIQCFRKQLL